MRKILLIISITINLNIYASIQIEGKVSEKTLVLIQNDFQEGVNISEKAVIHYTLEKNLDNGIFKIVSKNGTMKIYFRDTPKEYGYQTVDAKYRCQKLKCFLLYTNHSTVKR